LTKISLKVIFSAATVVGLYHYGMTGMEDAVASVSAGGHAAWGALLLNGYYAFRSHGGDGAETNNTSDSPAGRSGMDNFDEDPVTKHTPKPT